MQIGPRGVSCAVLRSERHASSPCTHLPPAPANAGAPIATESPANTDAYCKSVRATALLARQYATTPGADAPQKFEQGFADAQAKAPPELKAAYTSVFSNVNKVAAQKTIDDFNQTVCQVSVSGLPPVNN
jgi:hypothetical protein